MAVVAGSAAGVPAVAGKGHRRIEQAIRSAEAATGLQFCVYLGPVTGHSRTHAEEIFTAAGLHSRPSVLVLVAPPQQRVEIVTAESARTRIPDDAATRVIDVMVEQLRRGRVERGITAGVQALAHIAGPASPAPGTEELPNVIDDTTPRNNR